MTFVLLLACVQASTLVGQDVDLVVYGDARSGFWQKHLGPYRADQIHAALTTALGKLQPLSAQHGILFLGDAVSQGGCAEFWENKFRPALKNLSTAFRETDPEKLYFYPVIGDHETFLIPESREEETHTPPLCKLFDVIYPIFFDMRVDAKIDAGKPPEAGVGADGRQIRTFASEDEASVFRDSLLSRLNAVHESSLYSFRTYGQVQCPAQPASECSNPGVEHNDMLLAHCMMCAYQLKVCDGNCLTWAFKNEYAAKYGFTPFQDRLRQEPSGSTWYTIDYDIGSGGASRKLRILMLDTQSVPLTKPTAGAYQYDWIASKIRTLPRGSLLIAVGHQPPAMRPDLWDTVVRTARERSVQVLSLLAAHYHGFGGGAFAVWDSQTKVFDKVYLAISGDGGGRDFSAKETVTEDRVLDNRTLGQFGIQPAGAMEGWQVDSDAAAVSFLQIHLGEKEAVFGEWQVPLVVTSAGGSGVSTLSAGTPVQRRRISVPYR